MPIVTIDSRAELTIGENKYRIMKERHCSLPCGTRISIYNNSNSYVIVDSDNTECIALDELNTQIEFGSGTMVVPSNGGIAQTLIISQIFDLPKHCPVTLKSGTLLRIADTSTILQLLTDTDAMLAYS